MKLTRQFFCEQEGTEASKEDIENGILRPIVSSARLDSHGTRVISNTVKWKDKEYKTRFRDNRPSAPLNFMHMRDNNHLQEIGRWLNFSVDDSGLVRAVVRFDMADKFAAERFRKHKDGFATDWSIEFVPDLILEGDEANELYEELDLERDGATVFLGNEYWGLGDVPYGSQPDAHDGKQVDIRIAGDLEKLTKRIAYIEAELKALKSPENSPDNVKGEDYPWMRY